MFTNYTGYIDTCVHKLQVKLTNISFIGTSFLSSVYTGFWFIEGSVYTGFWFIEGSVYTGFWFIEGSVYTGFWFIEGSVYPGF